MCEADHGLPYEAVEVQVDGQTPTALVTKQVQRWEMYVPEARRVIAAIRALTIDI